MKHAPELSVQQWLNTDEVPTLRGLRGRVVLIKAFQMLCPGCVAHALPQAQEVANSFPPEDVVVLGLHTVFEHHEAQGTAVALKAFLHEYRLRFAVGIDSASKDKAIPQTMAAYEMQGTPTTILIDRNGQLRLQRFGRTPDIALGAHIASLLHEPWDPGAGGHPADDESCDDEGCKVPPSGGRNDGRL